MGASSGLCASGRTSGRGGGAVSKGVRSWLAWIGEVFAALRADPVLLVPAALVVIAALLASYLVWRFG